MICPILLQVYYGCQVHDMSNPGAGILWTGHNDGKICAFALDAKPGVALTGRTLNSWQAHRIGSVTVLMTTPWGELWSGSSRGIIRVWRNAHKQGGGAAPVMSTPLSCACASLGCVIAWDDMREVSSQACCQRLKCGFLSGLAFSFFKLL